MPNIEMKVRYRGLSRAREIAIQIGAELLWQDVQEDTYFVTQKGKLKLRESGLNGSELIPYLKTNQAGVKRSDYARIAVDDSDLVKRLLGELLGKQIKVRKKREVYLLHNVRIHLDEVEGLGAFLEFEAVFSDDTQEGNIRETGKVRELMQVFSVSESDLEPDSYPDLLLNEIKRLD